MGFHRLYKLDTVNTFRGIPKNQTSWKLAQNNVSFFVLPSTTRYQCVLLWRKNSKMLKNENLNWHRSFSKTLKIPKKFQKTLFLRWLIFNIFLQSVFCTKCIEYNFFNFQFSFFQFFNFNFWAFLHLNIVFMMIMTIFWSKAT